MLSSDAPASMLRAAAAAFAVDAHAHGPAAWALLCDALERATARLTAAAASGDGAAAAAAAAAARALLAAAAGNALVAQGVPPSVQWPRVVADAGITSSSGSAGVTLRTAAVGAACVGVGVRTGTHYFEVQLPPGTTLRPGCHLAIGFAPAAASAGASAGGGDGPASRSMWSGARGACVRTNDMRWAGSSSNPLHSYSADLRPFFRPGATLGVAADLSSGAVACHYDGAWLHEQVGMEMSALRWPEAPLFATVEFVSELAGAGDTPAFPPLTLRLGAPLPPGAPSRVKPDKWAPPGAAAPAAGIDAPTAARLRDAAGALLDALAGVQSSGNGEGGNDDAHLMMAITSAAASTRDGATALLADALAAGAGGAPLLPSRAAMRAAALTSAAKSPAEALRHAGDGTLAALCAAAEHDFRAFIVTAAKQAGGAGAVAALPPVQSTPASSDAAAPVVPAAAAALAPPDDPLASLSPGDAANVRSLVELLSARDAWEVYLELRAHDNDVQATANAWLEAEGGRTERLGPSYARAHGIPLSPPLPGGAPAASAPAQAAWVAAGEAGNDAAAAMAHVDAGVLHVLAQLQLGVYARAHGGDGDGADDAVTNADKDAAAALTAAVLHLCGAAAEHATEAMGAAAAGRSRRAWFRRASPIEALLPAAAAFLSACAAVAGGRGDWACRLATALMAAPPALRACAALELPGEPTRNCPLRLAWSAVVALSLDDGARDVQLSQQDAVVATAAAATLAATPVAPTHTRLRTQLSAALADWFTADEDELPVPCAAKRDGGADASTIHDASGAGVAPARSRLQRSHSVRLGPSSASGGSASLSPATSLAPAMSVRAAEPVSLLAPLLTDGAPGDALWTMCAPFWTPRTDGESSSQEGVAAACEAAVARAMLAALLHHGRLTEATASAAAARRAAHGALTPHALHALLPARVEQCAARAASAALELVEAHVHSEEGAAVAAERAAGLAEAVRERAALLLTLPPAALRSGEAADAATSATADRIARMPLLSPASSTPSSGGGGGLRAAQSVGAEPSGGGGFRAAHSVGTEATGGSGGSGLRPAQSVGLPPRRTLSRSSSMQPRASGGDAAAAKGTDEDDVGARRRTLFRMRAALSGSFRAGADPATRRDDRVVRFLSLALPQPRDAESDAAEPGVAPGVASVPQAPEQAHGLVVALRRAVALAAAADVSAARTVVLSAQLCLGAAQPSLRPDAAAADAADADAAAKQLSALHEPLTTGVPFVTGSPAWLLPYLLAPRIADAAPFLVGCMAPDALVDELLRDTKHAPLGATRPAAAGMSAAQLALHADAAFGGAAGGSEAAAAARIGLLEALLRGIAACRDELLQTTCSHPVAAAKASTASVLLGVLSSCRPMRGDEDAHKIVAALWTLITPKFAAAAPALAHAALHQLQALLPSVSPAAADVALAAAEGADAVVGDAAGSATVAALVALAAQAEQALADSIEQAAADGTETAAAEAAAMPAAAVVTFSAAPAMLQFGTATAGTFGAPASGGFGAAPAVASPSPSSGSAFSMSAGGGFGGVPAAAPFSLSGDAAFGTPAGGFGVIPPTSAFPSAFGGSLFGAPASSGFHAPPAQPAAPLLDARFTFGLPMSSSDAVTAVQSGLGGGGSGMFGSAAPSSVPLFARTPSPPFGAVSAMAPPGANPFAGVVTTASTAFGAPAAAPTPLFGASVFGTVTPAPALFSSAAFGMPAAPALNKPARVAGVASLGSAAAAALQRLAQCDAWRPVVAAFLARTLADWRASPPRTCVALGLLGGVGETLRAGVICTSEKTGICNLLVLRAPELTGPNGSNDGESKSLMLRLDAVGGPTSLLGPPDAQPADLPPASGVSDEESDTALAALLPMLTCVLDALLEEGVRDADAARVADADVASPRLSAAVMRALAQLCATSPARVQAALAGAGQLARVLRAGAGAPARLHQDARLYDAAHELEEVCAACAQAELRNDASSDADGVPHASSFWMPRHQSGGIPTPLLHKLGASAFVCAAPKADAAPDAPFWLKPTAVPAAASQQHVAELAQGAAASVRAALPPLPPMVHDFDDIGAWQTAPSTDGRGSFGSSGASVFGTAADGASGSLRTCHAQKRQDTFCVVNGLSAERRRFVAAAACRSLAACHCLQAALALLSAASPGSLAGASGAEVLAVITAGASGDTSLQRQRVALTGALTGVAPSIAAALVRDALVAVASSSTAVLPPQAAHTGMRVLATAIAAAEAGGVLPEWACSAVNTSEAAHALLCVAHGSNGSARRRALRLLARLLRARKALLLGAASYAQPSEEPALTGLPHMADIRAAFDTSFMAAQLNAIQHDYGSASLHALADVLMASEELAAVLPPPPAPPTTDAMQTDVAAWSRRARRVQPLGGDTFTGTFELAPLDASSGAPHAWSLLQANEPLGDAARYFEVRVQERAAAGVAVGVAVQQSRAQDVSAPSVAALADGLVRGASVPEPFAVFWASDGQLHSAAAIVKSPGLDLSSKLPFSNVWLPRYGAGDRVGIALVPPSLSWEKSQVELAFLLNGATVARHTFARTAEGMTGKVWAVRVRWRAACCSLRCARSS
jgi:hypothetical protein